MTLTRIAAWRAGALAFAAVLGLALAASSSAVAQTFTVLHSFVGYPTDGAGPGAGLLMDGSGNLYGTTSFFCLAREGFLFEMRGRKRGTTDPGALRG
jgi:hypothetical protein